MTRAPRVLCMAVGHDLAVGPIVTYDTKVGGKLPLSMSLRWVPTVWSRNRLDSDRTVMGSISLVFQARYPMCLRFDAEYQRDRGSRGDT